jgi:hypothetical protein
MQAHTFQHFRLGGDGVQERLIGLRPGGDRPGLVQQGPDPLHIPFDRLGFGQGGQRGRFGVGITRLPCDDHRLFGSRPQFGVVPAAMHVQGAMGQHLQDPGPRRAGRVGRDQPDRFAQVLGVIVPAEVVLQMAPGHKQERGPDRLRGGIDLPQRGLGQRDRPLIVPGPRGGPHRLFEHRGVIDADALCRVWHLLTTVR